MLDLFIIGGGVNGCAIARDAAGRGLSVALAEKGDLASETSSKSTKLFHGGLRYLEYFEFKLVRDALNEREILLTNLPHIAWPMRFVLPYHREQRFESGTPAAKILQIFMPWLKGRRPAWLIRFGLFLYDRFGGSRLLPKTGRLDLSRAVEGAPLRAAFKKAFEYSDVWVQDARLVVLMARDAAARGAHIMPRNKVLSAKRHAEHWEIKTEHGMFKARKLVNSSGPWVEEMARSRLNATPQAAVRLVKGSHIIVPKLYDHGKAYFFQGRDGRIIFALPYEGEYTLIGTTDEPHDRADTAPVCSESETAYLCEFANEYFAKPVQPEQVVGSYSGVRPLYDDGVKSATAATREYVLELSEEAAPLLNVFGGKITTHRKLAEDALALLGYDGAWTKDAPLAGGDFAVHERAALIAELARKHPALDADRVFSTYGTESFEIFKGEWGQYFGPKTVKGGLYACEVDHMMRHEFAQTAEDILWRRTKLGLSFACEEELAAYMKTRPHAHAPAGGEKAGAPHSPDHDTTNE